LRDSKIESVIIFLMLMSRPAVVSATCSPTNVRQAKEETRGSGLLGNCPAISAYHLEVDGPHLSLFGEPFLISGPDLYGRGSIVGSPWEFFRAPKPHH